jgi:hypothetical protein
MKFLASLLPCFFAKLFTNTFIDDLSFVETTLNVNNANYKGKLIEVDGSEIEFYRGKLKS